MAGPFAVVFDLDRVLVDARSAWVYTLEQAVLAATGQRVEGGRLVGDYGSRAWQDALAIVVDGPPERERARELCEQISERSALKQLRVYEGVGMALDALRGARVEIGAVSRLAHGSAMRQIEATGLDRFFTVLSPTPAGTGWKATARFEECRGYLDVEAGHCVFVSDVPEDIEQVAAADGISRWAGWKGESPGWPAIERPGDLRDALARAIR